MKEGTAVDPRPPSSASRPPRPNNRQQREGGGNRAQRQGQLHNNHRRAKKSNDSDDSDSSDDSDEQKGSSGGPDRRTPRVVSEFDARPRDLSRDALSWQGAEAKALATSHQGSRIFTQQKFSQLALPIHPHLSSLLEGERDKGGMAMTACTTIQSLAIPAAVARKQNLLIKSQTGSGKTLAYLIPVIHELMSLSPKADRAEGTRVLVIAPTRELCAQIADVLARLTKCCVWIVSGSISGGEKKKSEKARLRKGVTVLVGTPGRLLDHVRSTESFNLTKLRWIILDEIDRLMDMGFEQTVLEILSRIRGERLPGLKDSHAIDNDGKGNGGKTLTKRYSEQKAVFVKKVSRPQDLRYIMASATLTAAVKQLAWPIMGAFSKGSGESVGLAVVDGDHGGSVTNIQTEEELTAYTSKAKAPGVVSFMDDSEEGDPPITSTGDHSMDNTVSMEDGDSNSAANRKLRTTLSAGEVVSQPSKLSQFYMLVTCKWRLSALLSFLYLRRREKVIVFFSTCDSVDFHALLIKQMQWPTDLDGEKPGATGDSEPAVDASKSFEGFNAAAFEQRHREGSTGVPAVCKTLDPLDWKFTGVFGEDTPVYRLHGKVPQHYRKQVYNDFVSLSHAKGKGAVLLCTDVAARGLDLPQVDWIVQYDPPCETTDYVHRVGRTARKGLSGSALTMLLPSESMYVHLLASHGLTLSPMSSASMFVQTAQQEIPGARRFKNADEMVAVILQRRVERVVSANRPLTDAATQAFRSYVRAYATHSADTKGIFKVQSLHLGHVAKSFALKDKPKDLTGMGSGGGAKGDVIGRIFNGEFASRERLEAMKKEALAREKEKTERVENNKREGEKKKRKRERVGEEVFSDDESEGESESESEEGLEGERESADEGERDSEDERESEEKDEEESEEEGDSIQTKAEDLVKASAKLNKAKKSSIIPVKGVKGKGKGKDAPVSNGRTWTVSRSESVLGKRKLSFGKQAVKVAASGKFRKSGGYFRKKLRSQMSSEFSAS